MQQAHTKTRYRRTLSTGTINGTSVYNARSEELGTIKELMIDIEEGRVAYAVLSFGGFLGLGDKLFAIPWQAFGIDEDGERFLLNVEQETLMNAEGFDPNHWPDTADPEWGRRIHQHYGYEPYWDR